MKLGKKGKANQKNNAELKRIFEGLGITTCEMCNTRFHLTWAHSRKRRFITNDEMMKEVSLLCVVCHSKLEVLPSAEMYRRITAIIDNRKQEAA